MKISIRFPIFKLYKTFDITEDDSHKYADDIQKLADKKVADVDAALASKEEDIMKV